MSYVRGKRAAGRCSGRADPSNDRGVSEQTYCINITHRVL